MEYRAKVLEIAKDVSENCIGKNGCRNCVKECIMLKEYTEYPGDLFTKFLESGNFDELVAYSCNLCNQCTIVCPKSFQLGEFFLEIRKDFVKANNGNSPLKGHGAINMHQKLGFSNVFCTKVKGGMK